MEDFTMLIGSSPVFVQVYCLLNLQHNLVGIFQNFLNYLECLTQYTNSQSDIVK